MSVKCVLLPSKERGGGVELVDVTTKDYFNQNQDLLKFNSLQPFADMFEFTNL